MIFGVWLWNTIICQLFLSEWLAANQLEKISLIITNAHSKEVLESWDFNVENEPPEDENKNPNQDAAKPTSNKDLKRIKQEICSVMRQISATVTYLPLLDCICSFDILMHTLQNCSVPEKWDETEAVIIQNAQAVKLTSFSTGLHKVDTVVNYKMTN